MGKVTGIEKSQAVSAAQVATAPQAEKKQASGNVFSFEINPQTETKYRNVENIYKQITEVFCFDYCT